MQIEINYDFKYKNTRLLITLRDKNIVFRAVYFDEYIAFIKFVGKKQSNWRCKYNQFKGNEEDYEMFLKTYEVYKHYRGI